MKKFLLFILTASIFFGGSQAFAQADANYTMEELQYYIDQVNGNLTEIKETVSEIQEGKQCTVCEQEQQKEQKWYFNALLIITSVTATLSGLSLCLYFFKFKGFGELVAKIKTLTDSGGILLHIREIKEMLGLMKTAIDKANPSPAVLQGEIESLRSQIADFESKTNSSTAIAQSEEIKEKIKSLKDEIYDLETKYNEAVRKARVGVGKKDR